MSPSPNNRNGHKRQISISTDSSGSKSKLPHVSGFDELTRRTLAISRKTVARVHVSDGQAMHLATTSRAILMAFSPLAIQELSENPGATTLTISLRPGSNNSDKAAEQLSLDLDTQALNFICTWMAACCDHKKEFTPPAYPADSSLLMRVLRFSTNLRVTALENNVGPVVKEHVATIGLRARDVEFIWFNFPPEAPITMDMLHYVLRQQSKPADNSAPPAAFDSHNTKFNLAPDSSKVALDEPFIKGVPGLADALSNLSEHINTIAQQAKDREEQEKAKKHDDYLAREAIRQKKAKREEWNKSHEEFLVREMRRQGKGKKQDAWEKKRKNPGMEYLLMPGEYTRTGLKA